MIGQLTGLLIDQNDRDRCLIDVNGVGYVVYVSSRTLSKLPRPPEIARVLIETIVREDAILLYGFADGKEQEWFRLLTTVQGVGVRMALAIQSVLTPDELTSAIMTADKASLMRASGVGARLATRILTELNGKVASGSDVINSITISGQITENNETNIVADVLLALEGLGFRRMESQPIVGRVIKGLKEKNQPLQLDHIIREALRELAR
ncbi:MULTISPECIES: Holliday junction branch migration protein RuvA [Commensalibacter]|uniref:Holliday junction branch migration protein RuvA n=1 Tax=Commensalibacter TaxID=1079922 RepID=UPI0012D91EB1|nr:MULTISPECIES: Holliday junction branch migration protein RuvA [Commensalibacter]MCT6842489.1 Holliday junction branch migration protein RuvA [Commensalibacter sp.]MBH9969868.1 Holliday junction branch migration protein RuvA [Commensalibacter sp. M0265]MBH9977236.1 Holliday junction branch migration protein RuvA [Commensalibacter sp. M0266]MBH9992903.1 Holliday junction branch migration protein RuvA [Commensalibacter sp. M0270]MBI0046412.1 Holliday junction branch migration protein RuvA [Com